MAGPAPEPRTAYPFFQAIPTRWMDNDAYGHVNNVVYYSYFDTVVNAYLIAQGGLDFTAGPVIGLCVESHCHFLASVAFPDVLEAGLRVAHVGRSSVRYEVGIFLQEAASAAAAQGHFVHVYVDRATRRPVELPSKLREAVERLSASAP
jgi:acyl-CoA thioester hydrolase